jgi:hypothetical protein
MYTAAQDLDYTDTNARVPSRNSRVYVFEKPGTCSRDNCICVWRLLVLLLAAVIATSSGIMVWVMYKEGWKVTAMVDTAYVMSENLRAREAEIFETTDGFLTVANDIVRKRVIQNIADNLHGISEAFVRANATMIAAHIADVSSIFARIAEHIDKEGNLYISIPVGEKK